MTQHPGVENRGAREPYHLGRWRSCKPKLHDRSDTRHRSACLCRAVNWNPLDKAVVGDTLFSLGPRSSPPESEFLSIDCEASVKMKFFECPQALMRPQNTGNRSFHQPA